MSVWTPSVHRRAAAAIAVLACTVIAGVAVAALRLEQHRAQQHSDADWARTLFEGHGDAGGQRLSLAAALLSPANALPPLPGRLAGHTLDLPAAATRCVNCHAGVASTAALDSAVFATPLHVGTLRLAMSRRGGPPSTYDASSLCRVLRDGIDPAFVIVDQAMPRYQASDAQCAALWAWLTRSKDARDANDAN